MSKRISELIDELESKYLDEVEIEETERLDTVSFDRIKEVAMKNLESPGIEEQEADLKYIDLADKKKKKIGNKKVLKKMFIPLVAALTLIGVSAMAIKSNDTLRELFGEALPFIQSELQEISKSVTEGGVTFTAESAAIENKAGLFILSFTKEDGSSFEEGTVVRDLVPNAQKHGGMGWSKQTTMTEEGKKLVYIVDLSADKNLYGQKITYTAKDLGVWKEDQEVLPIDLYDAYQQTMAINYNTEVEAWETYDTSKGLNLALIESYKGYELDRVELKDQTLELITSTWVPNGEETLDVVNIQLIDTRTGEEIENKGGSSTWNPSDQIQRHLNRFSGVTLEDLPYLQMQIEYSCFITQTKGQWEVAFELDKNKNLKEKKLIKNIENESMGVMLHDLEISKLGLKLEGLRYKGKLDYLNGYLEMKDGTKVEIIPSGMSSKWNLVFVSHYKRGKVLTEEEVREKNDRIGQQSIQEEENEKEGLWTTITNRTSEVSVQTGGIDYDINENQFIDLENVEAIVLEGVRIPLK